MVDDDVSIRHLLDLPLDCTLQVLQALKEDDRGPLTPLRSFGALGATCRRFQAEIDGLGVWAEMWERWHRTPMGKQGTPLELELKMTVKLPSGDKGIIHAFPGCDPHELAKAFCGKHGEIVILVLSCPCNECQLGEF